MEGNQIKSVAKDGTTLGADGATVVDGGGQTLMPGLVESHAHISFCDTPTLEGLGDIPGPRMRAASPELTVTGGLGDVRRAHMYRETFAICCDGADEFRKAAREMCREGVDTLKINPSGDEFIPFARAHLTVMNEAEVAAVCEVGRSRGKMVAAHSRSAESVKMAVRNGVDVVYHATLSDEEALDMLEAENDRIFVGPAMGIMYATAQGEGAGWGIDKDHPVAIYFARELEMCIENMKKLKQRGVRVLPGGDYGFAWNPIGTNARDLEHFVKLLDYTPLEAISAATKLGGEIMDMNLGEVKEGCLADLLLVDGDPSTDVTILQDANRLSAIMLDGAFHKGPATTAEAGLAAAE